MQKTLHPDTACKLALAVLETEATAVQSLTQRIDQDFVRACETLLSCQGRVVVLGNDDPERLQITIRDSGVGFAPDTLERPKIEEKLKAASKRGWGLTIIKGLMDEVDIHSGPNGTTVVMSKLR